MTISRTLSTLVLLILTACAFTQAQEAVPLPTPTTVRVLQTTPVPTIDRQFQNVASPSPELSPTPGAITCPAPEEQNRTQYVVEAKMDYAARTVAVHQVVDYINRGERSLEQIVLLVKPNARPDIFTLETVTLGADGAGLSYELTGLRLTV